MATMTSTYEGIARNVSPATLAAALLLAVPGLDPSVPVDKLGLAFVIASSSTPDAYRARVAIQYSGPNGPDVIGQLTGLWVNELSKAVNTPVSFVGLVIV
jgi:hypothetical protein